MKVHGTSQIVQPADSPLLPPGRSQGEDFAAYLGQECLLSVNNATAKEFIASSIAPVGPTASSVQSAPPTDGPKTTMKNGVSAYKAQKPQAQSQPALSDLGKYVDDQLLNNPGGDRYDLDAKEVAPEGSHSSTERVGKDVKDVFSNAKNFFADMFFGAKFCYRDENNQIQEARKKGLIGSVVDFFKDLGSAFSFGAWRPDGDPEPKGVGGHLKYAGSKLFKAFSTDLLQNVPASINHMVEDVAHTGLNLLETIPDATIGNLDAGEKAVTKGFDGAQVLINYVSDIAPGGEAWQRVHALSFKEMKPPILNNLSKPESGTEDSRWRYIRNTSFRKGVETVGAILADVLTFGFVRWISSSSEKTHHRN